LMEPTDPRRVQFEEWVRQLPGDGAPDQLRPR
jgi:hypothetical protein